ncbi:hypothetical protein [Olleya sp. R77988]|uniref:hypothetical protein n=1 Tax=Olleya sp. R77988 TaxID=3093875 RepID=UPI0037C93C4A
MSTNIFEDFDEQSQKALQGLKFLSFEDVKRGLVGRDPFEGIRTNKILMGETIRGMTNVHPLVVQKFNNRTTQEISRLYFPDAEKKFLKTQGINLNIDVDCEEARKLLVGSTEFFYDHNNNNIIDKGEFAFQLHVFSSKNGLKLKEAFECVIPQKGELLVFIEDNKDDWSKQIVRIKIAQDVRDAIKKSDLHHSKVLDFINRKTDGEGLSA